MPTAFGITTGAVVPAGSVSGSAGSVVGASAAGAVVVACGVTGAAAGGEPDDPHAARNRRNPPATTGVITFIAVPRFIRLCDGDRTIQPPPARHDGGGGARCHPGG